MRKILRKEARLSAQPIVYCFLLSGLLFLLPGYPVLCGAFFLSLGLYQSFRYARECGDLEFSILLPIAKKEIVWGKFAFSCMIELCCFALMLSCALVRMTVLSDAPVYRENALMNANLFALSMALVLFGLFNWVFLGGFFKTGYQTGKPFLLYMAVCFPVIAAAETLHHLPGMAAFNAFGFDHLGMQLGALAAGVLCYGGLTALSCRRSGRAFEKLDL